jgi:flagellar hook assembly protein FlgD
LEQNYPNPFNPATTISFSLRKRGRVELVVYDVAGRRVRTLVSGERSTGVLYRVVWDGKNDEGQAVASGVYFYRLVADDFVDTRKMVLLQ